MINFDDYVNENRTEHNINWPYIPEYPYRILSIGGWRSGKTNVLLKLIEKQPDIDQIYLYSKYPYEAKYQHLIKIHEKVIIITILELILSIQMICMMFTKIFVITILMKKIKY